ncbi:sporulation integral membrane protein YlbJ [Paenibacillus lentus]|uniref:Sporulation integral membrane protein YlbJ n=1 Tax=Paenibacillus lentus TaxID=1338368 RepID=A0A3Q8SAJ3_9BACL|nr:sporulation integral membrane protein YlbJ [Paenibacillus lentus]AZK46227.1 sporulation integral membrane protein YlbJ [Paenibacillus lentus]
MNLARFTTSLMVITLATVGVLMLSYPQASWEAGVTGLAIWWEVLFPSLFPFFVISELMLGFGIVHFIGKLLDPLMKPLFRIPGSGGFVAAMGFASGYPVSAKLATKLRQQQLISRIEGERLVAFTTSSDPIFLIGAVSVGFFGSSKLAGILALAHYGSALILGFVMRFYGTSQVTLDQEICHQINPVKSSTPSSKPSNPPAKFSLRLALRAMHEARQNDGRSLGELLKQAISSSLQLMAVVGGLVVVFSVILELLTASGMMTLLYASIESFLGLTGLPSALAEPFVGGMFEVTLGAKAAAAPAAVPLIYKAAAAAFILSWGGLSVHAQVASILNGADLRYAPFLAARFIHGIMAMVLLLLLWNPLMGSQTDSAWLNSLGKEMPTGWSSIPDAFLIFLKMISVLLILSLLAQIIHRLLTRGEGRSRK